jgi:hypothetical protein
MKELTYAQVKCSSRWLIGINAVWISVGDRGDWVPHPSSELDWDSGSESLLPYKTSFCRLRLWLLVNEVLLWVVFTEVLILRAAILAGEGGEEDRARSNDIASLCARGWQRLLEGTISCLKSFSESSKSGGVIYLSSLGGSVHLMNFGTTRLWSTSHTPTATKQ